MTNTAILAVSALLVFAYLLDIFGRRTKLPAVVLLVATGMVGRQVMERFDLHLHWVDPLLPAIGTFGHGNTYAGHPVGCAVAVKTLEIYQREKIVDHVEKVSPTFLR